ncbi:FadR/GntR family transcriptional regulator [Paeniglutamicibacter cryotolerans]|uniref:DNA-binding FadR family transcriptional regulator n=1 Tax=Paeniglutamicibacter cryotolerans TaxID=670079 RepID=A0A839QEK5_9MICC|nr:FadR/GntR family transcriptional regulator [Paeniglutamicibacter cryotolerans]MBB2994698.1 DNA-binding FadR family transcriptional regulator [Paeniglutamicibacter cryotolerans]
MSLENTARLPLSDAVTGQLRNAIVTGVWALHERIPAEPVLMEQLGVSRGTLREAIKALAHSGLLEVRRGDGTYVRATSEIHGAVQRAYRNHSDEEVLQVRFGLDTQAARLACTAATEKQVASMRGLLAQRQLAWDAEDAEAWIGADWAFHLTVAEASGNSLLLELYGSFGDVFHGREMAQRLREGFAGCRSAGHEDLVDAIEAGDAEAACDSVHSNLSYCMEWMP